MTSGFLPTDYTIHNQTIGPGGAGAGGGGGGGLMHTQFVFPLLKNAEILQCMTELGIELNKTEMTEPNRHKERVRKVFWQLLDICCGITEDDLQKKSPKNLSTDNNDNNPITTYPELHDDFVDILFFRELRKCMLMCGVDDFSWKDLLHPTSKRFRCQLSAFINMAKFREEQLRVYAELNEPRAQLLLTLEEIHNEHDQLAQQCEAVQMESNADMEEMEGIIRECHDLEAEIAKSNKLQASKREEAAALKREVNELKDQLASAAWALQEAQAEEEGLMGQLVSSPDRRQGELEDKKRQLETEKQECRSLEEEIQNNKTRMVHMQAAAKTLQDMIALEKQVLEEANKFEKIRVQIEETEADITSNREQALEITNQIEEAEGGLMRVEEKLNHLRKHGKMKMDAALDRLNIAKEQLVLVEKERREGLARVEAGEMEVRALQDQLRAEQQKTDEEIASLVTQYKAMEHAFLARHERRMKALDSATMMAVQTTI